MYLNSLTPIVSDCGEVTVANPVGSVSAVTELVQQNLLQLMEPTEAPLYCNSNSRNNISEDLLQNHKN